MACRPVLVRGNMSLLLKKKKKEKKPLWFVIIGMLFVSHAGMPVAVLVLMYYMYILS